MFSEVTHSHETGHKHSCDIVWQWLGVDRLIFEFLNVCACVLGHIMQTNISGTSWEILGFLMIQNILCFTSGIVNALCIIDMGLLVVNRQCDTYCPMKIYVNEGTPYKTWRLGSFLTTYFPLGSLGYFMNSTPDKGKRNLHQYSIIKGYLAGDMFDINLQHVRVQEKHQEYQTESLKMWLYCIFVATTPRSIEKELLVQQSYRWANVKTFEPPRYDSVSSERQHQPHRTWKFHLQSVVRLWSPVFRLGKMIQIQTNSRFLFRAS